MTLLREIQDAATDSRVELADTLRRCKVLAARLRHQELASWASHELNGYREADVPPYRIVGVQSFGHFSSSYGAMLRDAAIPMSTLPPKVRKLVSHRKFIAPVSQLAGDAKLRDGALQAKWNPDIIAHLQQTKVQIYEDAVVVDAWQLFSTSTLMGILDTVRTRVLDFALAIEAENPDLGEVEPDGQAQVPPERLHHIFNVTVLQGNAIVGNSGVVSVTTGGDFSPAISQAAHTELRSLLKQLREHLDQVPEEDAAVASTALAGLESELGQTRPDPERVKRYVELFGTVVTVAAPTVELLKKLFEALGW